METGQAVNIIFEPFYNNEKKKKKYGFENARSF